MEAIAVSDPMVPEAEAERLSAQSAKVLARLRMGPATNNELKAITHRFGARLHDIRKAGISIQTYGRNHRTGECSYRLMYLETILAAEHHTRREPNEPLD